MSKHTLLDPKLDSALSAVERAQVLTIQRDLSAFQRALLDKRPEQETHS